MLTGWFIDRGPHVFSSCGSDGSCRLFDLRSLEHSTIIYESPNLDPLLRLEWNKQDPNYLATFKVDSQKTIILDIRVPSLPVASSFRALLASLRASFCKQQSANWFLRGGELDKRNNISGPPPFNVPNLEDHYSNQPSFRRWYSFTGSKITLNMYTLVMFWLTVFISSHLARLLDLFQHSLFGHFLLILDMVFQ